MGKLFTLLNFRHSISITHHSSLIPHYSSLITHFFTLIWQHHFYFHHSIFSHYSWVPHLSVVGPLCVFNYNIVIELWVMETENNQKLFLVSITHNSKIRELSYGNGVIETELLFDKLFTMGPTIFELWVMKTENWVIKKLNPSRL